MSTFKPKLISVQATSASITFPNFNGAFITNRGATGAATYTLDDPTTANAGSWVEFFIVADQTVTVRAVSASKMTVFNNATATSIAYSTGSQKIGNGMRCTSDGTTWLVTLSPATTSAAQTTATATIA